MALVYHGSHEGGITRLTPLISSHGRPYVYAARKPVLALLFSLRWNSFIFNLSLDSRDVPELTERSYDEIFAGKPGWLYTLDGGGFMENATGFPGEVVSPCGAAVPSSRYFPDIRAELDAAAARVSS